MDVLRLFLVLVEVTLLVLGGVALFYILGKLGPSIGSFIHRFFLWVKKSEEIWVARRLPDRNLRVSILKQKYTLECLLDDAEGSLTRSKLHGAICECEKQIANLNHIRDLESLEALKEPIAAMERQGKVARFALELARQDAALVSGALRGDTKRMVSGASSQQVALPNPVVAQRT